MSEQASERARASDEYSPAFEEVYRLHNEQNVAARAAAHARARTYVHKRDAREQFPTLDSNSAATRSHRITLTSSDFAAFLEQWQRWW